MRGAYLEGTGSIVFDHVARVAYACLSSRTHRAPLEELCDELGYAPCAFAAAVGRGPVYHTNVLLAVGTAHVVVAAESVASHDRERVMAALAASGRHIERSTRRRWRVSPATCSSCVRATAAVSWRCPKRAAAAFGPAALERCAPRGAVVAAPIPTIETLGGGSVRCMLAEVFLPRELSRRPQSALQVVEELDRAPQVRHDDRAADDEADAHGLDHFLAVLPALRDSTR